MAVSTTVAKKTSALAARSAKLAEPQMMSVLDNYILTQNNRGVAPKGVPSKLKGTFEYFTSPYELDVLKGFVSPTYFFTHMQRKVVENVGYLAPATGLLFGTYAYATEFKRQEDMHHRF